MFKSNLNRQMKLLPPVLFSLLKMSAFGLVWNLIFHSLMLSLLVYWSFSSRRADFNQFWSENQILLATLSQGALILFFREQLKKASPFSSGGATKNIFFTHLLRGALFTALIVGGLILSKQYVFLGFTSQANLTFFSSYAWIFRTLLLLAFLFFIQLFLHTIIAPRLPHGTPAYWKTLITAFTALAIYFVWFDLSFAEAITLILLYLLFDQFWEGFGFLSAFFVLTHAVLSLPWMGNEFSGLAQLKESPTKMGPFDPHFFELPTLHLILFFLLIAFKIIPFYYSRRKGLTT